jgi:hypothetical protein
VTTKDIAILQGDTFRMVVRWGTEPYLFAAITGITQSAPARITAPAHGLASGWPVAILSVQGMTAINASATPLKAKDFHAVTVVDADTITVDDLSASGFNAYSGGGVLQFLTPQDLTGYTARMMIKDKVGGTQLYLLDITSTHIALDLVDLTISLNIPATDSALFAWSKGVYDLKMTSPGGTVTTLLSGAVSVVPTVTI